jgi:hypothetical protein
MNITLSLDDKLVKEVRKIAVERDTTLTGLVRAHLEELARESAASGRKRREREALELSFKSVQLSVGKKTWRREDLYDRPGRDWSGHSSSHRSKSDRSRSGS